MEQQLQSKELSKLKAEKAKLLESEKALTEQLEELKKENSILKAQIQNFLSFIGQ